MNSEALDALLHQENMIPAIQWLGEQIPGGFFIYRADESQEILFANQAVLRIFGCKDMNEFIMLTGNTFRGMVHPDDVKAIQASIDQQIANSNNDNLDYVEYRILRKDGSVRWVDDYGHFAQFPGYGDVYYVFIGDITDKHLIQEENNRRANVYQGMLVQFNAMAENSLTVVRSNITKGIIEDVRGKDLYPEDFIGGDISEMTRVRAESFLTPGDRLRYEQTFPLDTLIERYYQGLGPATFVGYCRRHSGKKCFVKFSGSALVDPITGDAIAFGVETEYNNERVAEILNNNVLAQQYDMVSYIVGDNYGVVIGDAANIKRGSIFPKKSAGIYTEYVRSQVLPAVAEGEREAVARALDPYAIKDYMKNHESYTVDVNCEIDGEKFNKRFTYYMVDKDAQFYILLKSDVTDVIRKEHEMNELLANALREAENANAAKTSFLSNMSHEIRTPMNAIVGLDSIALQLPNLPEQVREYLEKIGASAKHLLSIINDILDMSRIESGRVTLKREDFSFSNLIEQINTMIQAQCRDKGLTYDCRIIGKLNDRYIGDDMKLKQVLINILSNAIKFTNAPGSVTLTIEQTALFENNATLRFIISDTGIGMDPSFLPKIFDAFSHENSGSNNKYGSTGLGMAITKNIVEMMNGNISVKSIKGVGSEFIVTITLSCSDSKYKNVSFNPKNLHVLVIDDDPIACQHAKLVLEEVGIIADTCLNGDDALKAIELYNAKLRPYNLILIDWKMPDKDGMSIAKEIRDKYQDNTTIIILTAYNWDDIMSEAIGVGVDSFMSKPLFAESVLNEFEQVIQRKNILQANAVADLTGRKILLAEDVDINAEIMETILSMREMQCDRAENGQIALDLFSQKPVGYYDAILMDVRMPVMNGLEAAAAIRSMDRIDAKTIPIIAMTANAFDEDVQNSLQAGMNAHLSKPVEVDHLYETLEKLIRDD